MSGRKTSAKLDSKVTIRIPRELLRALADVAAREHRSLNGEILKALETHTKTPPTGTK